MTQWKNISSGLCLNLNYDYVHTQKLYSFVQPEYSGGINKVRAEVSCKIVK